MPVRTVNSSKALPDPRESLPWVFFWSALFAPPAVMRHDFAARAHVPAESAKGRLSLVVRATRVCAGTHSQKGTSHVPRTSSICRGGGQPRRKRLHLLRSSLVLTRPELPVAVLALQCAV